MQFKHVYWFYSIPERLFQCHPVLLSPHHPIGLEAIRVPPKAAILALRDYRPHSEQTERR
ncbi:protein of unknown function [Pseudomonas mediterranea]